jgi:hypothetical protein
MPSASRPLPTTTPRSAPWPASRASGSRPSTPGVSSARPPRSRDRFRRSGRGGIPGTRPRECHAGTEREGRARGGSGASAARIPQGRLLGASSAAVLQPAMPKRRRPSWACHDYEEHGNVVCPECLRIYEAHGRRLQGWDLLPPRTTFGRGWFSVGAVHWFPATDDAVFPSRDGKRLLAQAICGGICDVTFCYAPRAERPCRKCVQTLDKLRA